MRLAFYTQHHYQYQCIVKAINMIHNNIIKLYTLYLALLTMRLPSRSQLTEGLGLPKAVQVKVVLPPSLASTY